jgi:hypothetical protein
MQEASFSKYGKSFQESLALMILEDRPFCEQIEEVMDINFFELNYLRVFTSLIFDYKNKYGTHPSADIMTSLLKTKLDDETEISQKQIREFFYKNLDTVVDGQEYIKETSLDFCKKQKLKEAILKSVDLLQSSSFDDIKVLIDDALKLGTDNNHGHDYKKDFEARYVLRARNPIKTGWDHIDNISKSGLGKGELGVVIAPTGAGKSMALVHLGAEALKEGRNVIHYTLELAEETIGLRYDSCISKVPLSDLHGFKEDVYETCMDVTGELLIKEYPTKSASPTTLRKSLDKIKKTGKNIDMIIVDYADILKASGKYKEKRNELESIYEELRAIAQEFECCVWTASQTNRSGLNAEVITMEAISEAFNKCFIADFIFSISRTVKDKTNNTGRMFVAKNRNGPDGLVYPIFMDTSNVTIKVLEPTNEGVEEIKENSLKKQAQELKEKYKKFRKQG